MIPQRPGRELKAGRGAIGSLELGFKVQIPLKKRQVLVRSRPVAKAGGNCWSQTATLFILQLTSVLVCSGHITKYYRLQGLNNRNVFSHSSGVGSPRSRWQQGWSLPRPCSRPPPWLAVGCLLPVSSYHLCV